MTDLTFTPLDLDAEKSLTLVTGDREAVLIDAGFTRANGHRAVAAILDSGKKLTTVFISAGDPDFYFGAEVLQDAFPDARFLAPADVVEHINRTYEDKIETWSFLGANLPTRLVDFTPIESDRIPVDEHELLLLKAEVQPANRGWYLFEPVSRSIVGGTLVVGGLHVWTADNPTVESRAGWLAALDQLEGLRPTRVIGGHRAPGFPTDVRAVQHTRDYLRHFESIIAESATGAEAEQKLLAAYPDLGLAIAATVGAPVAKGETTWG